MLGSERVFPQSTRKERRIHRGEVILFGQVQKAGEKIGYKGVLLSHDLARLTLNQHWWNLPDDFFDGNPDSLELTAQIQKAYRSRRVGPEAVSRVISRFRGIYDFERVTTDTLPIPTVTDGGPSVIDAYPTVQEHISTEAPSYDSVER